MLSSKAYFILILPIISIQSNVEFLKAFEFLNLSTVPNLEVLIGYEETFPREILNLLHNSSYPCNLGIFQANNYSRIPNWKSSNDLLIIVNPETESNISTSFKKIAVLVQKMPVSKQGISYFILIWPTTVDSEIEMVEILRHHDEVVNYTKYFTIDTNVFVLFQLTNSTKFTLWEIYRIKNMNNFKEMIRPNEFMNFGEFTSRVPSTRRQTFHSVFIAAVAVNDESYEADTKFSQSIGRWPTLESGLSVSLYRDLKYMLNFSEMAFGGGWMYADENGTLAGRSAYALFYAYADISISQETMGKNLVGLITYLHPTYPLSVVAFVKRPEYSLSRDIYIGPFSDELWICLMAVCLGIAICFEVILRCKSWMHSRLLNRDEQLKGQGLLFTTGWLCQQGWYVFPATGALRVLFFTAYFTGVVFYGAFTAALVSKLSVRVSQLNSLQDLLNNQYSLLISSASVSMMDYSQGFEAYYGNNARVTPMNTSDILDRLLNSKAALMFYWDSIDPIFSYNRTDADSSVLVCDTIATFWIVQNKPSGMVVRKGSPFREIFNQKIIKIKEAGLNFRYVKHYELKTQPQCLPTSQIRHTSLSLIDIFSSFYLLLVGIGVSLVVILIERCRSLVRLRSSLQTL